MLYNHPRYTAADVIFYYVRTVKMAYSHCGLLQMYKLSFILKNDWANYYVLFII